MGTATAHSLIDHLVVQMLLLLVESWWEMIAFLAGLIVRWPLDLAHVSIGKSIHDILTVFLVLVLPILLLLSLLLLNAVDA